ncbi:hypothetical protein [Zhihengliuella halotolerans]|uniref:Heavy metal transporter n=1 Tax=Zhihengliuella halotolerans TaxID=370736 RepID=A0A4Q8AA74_9MICC|nr:hypothetical protein [Zhihengliuella halotolerans]RZU61002.1 hypothetical protein EV380_0557 [Zhihengliuella halotolerans]
MAARRRRRRRFRAFLTLALSVAVVAVGIYGVSRYAGESQILVREQCTAFIGSERHTLAPDQAANAALIGAVSVERGLRARAATIGIATSMQESKLRNIDYGDEAGPDSRGLFQQRPSQGWGTEEQVMDPLYAANRFYAELERFDYSSMRVTEAAQKVQRSAFPEAYEQHEPTARAFASALTGHSPASLDCTLRRAEAAGDAAAVRDQLGEQHSPLLAARAEVDGRRLSIPTHASGGLVDSNELTQRTGWSIAQWAVARAGTENIESVSFGGLIWNRAENRWVQGSTTDGHVIVTVSAAPGTPTG